MSKNNQPPQRPIKPIPPQPTVRREDRIVKINPPKHRSQE
jgi:hypothetical protein